MKARLHNIFAWLFCLGILCSLQSCSEETAFESDPFVVAFSNLSSNLQEMDSSSEIALEYSEIAVESGSVSIQIHAKNAVYGVDFKTIPEATNNNITLPITSGEITNKLTFLKLNPFLDETTSIEFAISDISYTNANIQGYTKYTISTKAALGGHLTPNIGGPNEANQVFIDLSNKASTAIQRDSWDLGFYNGDVFRVTINGSVYMAAGATSSTNIDQVNTEELSTLKRNIAVGTFDPANKAYIDAPDGDILKTAIAEVSDNDVQNKVYLINLGYRVGTIGALPGSVAIAGDHRGWKKIRILKRDANYILQYANLEDTTHQEITISKTPAYNFTHFSFNSNSIVNVEPEKEKWDISFTVFTNIIEGAGSYGYSDFVTQNTKAGALAYQVYTTESTFEDFSLAQVSASKFSNNQITIGSNWREIVPEHKLFNDRFYIVKDPNGNIYKLQFLAFKNNEGERGHPEFKYELLQ